MRSYKAKGVVLHSLRYGDSGLVVYMLTDVLGRQTYLVRGVRSRTGRGNRSALFQPMFVVEFEGLESPKSQMHGLKDLSSALPLVSLPFDIRKSSISLFMAEVLYRLIRESEANSPLFDFVCASVAALDAMQQGVANFHLWFLVRLSALLGFAPGNEYAPGDWFDIQEGLFTPHAPVHGVAMNRDNARILSLLSGCGPEELAALPLSRSGRVDFLNSVLVYVGYHLDAIHCVQSVRILSEVF